MGSRIFQKVHSYKIRLPTRFFFFSFPTIEMKTRALQTTRDKLAVVFPFARTRRRRLRLRNERHVHAYHTRVASRRFYPATTLCPDTHRMTSLRRGRRHFHRATAVTQRGTRVVRRRWPSVAVAPPDPYIRHRVVVVAAYFRRVTRRRRPLGHYPSHGRSVY